MEIIARATSSMRAVDKNCKTGIMLKMLPKEKLVGVASSVFLNKTVISYITSLEERTEINSAISRHKFVFY